MRTTILLVFALAACDESGSFELVDPTAPGDGDTDTTRVDTDVAADDTDDTRGGGSGGPTDTDRTTDTDRPTDTDAPVDPTVRPPRAAACGPWLAPTGTLLGATSHGFAGDATIAPTGLFQTSWSGCEVERSFTARGVLACEIVREVSGAQVQGGFRDPQLVYDITETVDASATTCRQSIGLTLRMGVDVDVFRGTATLFRATRSSDWTEVGTFPIQGDLSGFTFSYVTDLAP
ncbi:MAG: hypothetical protein H6733_05950 [Alphaproteobacteria bacterium]|nr:hypothetical protein [Alphaproteobacteria bacterium]